MLKIWRGRAAGYRFPRIVSLAKIFVDERELGGGY
jgi:hypothetical protein